MQHRLAPTHRHDGRAELREPVEPVKHGRYRDGRGDLVVLVAVGAVDVAAASVGMIWTSNGCGRVQEPAHELAHGAHLPVDFSSADASQASIPTIEADPPIYS